MTGKPSFPLLLSIHAKSPWHLWIYTVHWTLQPKLPTQSLCHRSCVATGPLLSLANAFATQAHSHTCPFSFPGCCCPAGVMATLKASCLKATRCWSAPPWRTAGTPAQQGPGAASMASGGPGKGAASSGTRERPLTPTETLLTVKGRAQHLAALFPGGFKAWEHRRKCNSAGVHLGHTSPYW